MTFSFAAGIARLSKEGAVPNDILDIVNHKFHFVRYQHDLGLLEGLKNKIVRHRSLTKLHL